MANEPIELKPYYQPFVVKQGDTFVYGFQMSLNGSPMPLGDMDKIQFEVRKKAKGEILMTKTLGDGLSIGVAPNDNVLYAKFDINIKEGVWVYELEFHNNVTDVNRTYIGGPFEVVVEVSKYP